MRLEGESIAYNLRIDFWLAVQAQRGGSRFWNNGCTIPLEQFIEALVAKNFSVMRYLTPRALIVALKAFWPRSRGSH